MIEYVSYTSCPNEQLLVDLKTLYQHVFDTSEDILQKMQTKPKLLMIFAVDENKLVGYKLGYEVDLKTFYSWLGGVDETYRDQGIAAALMKKQHSLLYSLGYEKVRTKTMNKWRSMLVLNIKSGFDVVDTYTDENEIHKIVLEKNLKKNDTVLGTVNISNSK